VVKTDQFVGQCGDVIVAGSNTVVVSVKQNHAIQLSQLPTASASPTPSSIASVY